MYQHNDYDHPCKFYGTQYKPKIMFVSNQNPSQPKSYNAIAVEANIVPHYVLFYNEYPYIQESDLVDYDFRDIEGVWNATIYRNILQPTATGFSATSRMTGEKMRAVAMWVMIDFSVTTFTGIKSPAIVKALELKFVDLNYTISSGNVNV